MRETRRATQLPHGRPHRRQPSHRFRTGAAFTCAMRVRSMSSTERPLPRVGGLCPPCRVHPGLQTAPLGAQIGRPRIRRYRPSQAARHGRGRPTIVAPSRSL